MTDQTQQNNDLLKWRLANKHPTPSEKAVMECIKLLRHYSLKAIAILALYLLTSLAFLLLKRPKFKTEWPFKP